MNKFYISEQMNSKDFTALSKARNDIEEYFSKNKYNKLDIYINILQSKHTKLITRLELIFLLLKVKHNDYIYFQYPYYNFFLKK